MSNDTTARISHADLLQLKRWNTPTIYNGWEQVTNRYPAADAFNVLTGIIAAVAQFGINVKTKFKRDGEW